MKLVRGERKFVRREGKLREKIIRNFVIFCGFVKMISFVEKLTMV
jgi:hypothetical protein